MVEFQLRNGAGSIKLRYIVEDRDRHGNVRIYVRRPGRPKVRLHQQPGTDEFLAEYQAALTGAVTSDQEAAAKKKRTLPTAAPGNLRWVCEQYYGSGEYKRLASSTQIVRRRVLDALCETYGHLPVNRMGPEHIRKLRDDKAGTPDAANNLVKTLRQMFSVAAEARWISHNPAAEVKKLRTSSLGHHTWTMEEVGQFEACWPIGSKPRLAMALLLYTGQRRSDVVRMGPQHIRNGCITITQAKNENCNPVTVTIPILGALQDVLNGTPIGHLAFLVTAYGRPYTQAGFGIRFREWCDKAGLPHCSAHGLRKAMLTRLAELGASELEMAAISGHRNMDQLRVYTRAARQTILAQNAITRLSAGTKPERD